jgi:hypothetical protein
MSAGDFNRDGKADASDYVLWKNTYGSTLALAADGNGNQIVDDADYTDCRNNIVTSAESAGGADVYSGNSVLARISHNIGWSTFFLRRFRRGVDGAFVGQFFGLLRRF